MNADPLRFLRVDRTAHVLGFGTSCAVEAGSVMPADGGPPRPVALKLAGIHECFAYALLAAARHSVFYKDLQPDLDHVCGLYGILMERGSPELVLQQCGDTVFDWVQALPSDGSVCGYRAPQVVAPFRGIAAVLRALHDVGIVHSDLQSRNVAWVDCGLPTQRLVLMDLNIARVVGNTEGVFVACTDGYRSVAAPGPFLAPAFDTFAFAVQLLDAVTAGYAAAILGRSVFPRALARVAAYGAPVAALPRDALRGTSHFSQQRVLAAAGLVTRLGSFDPHDVPSVQAAMWNLITVMPILLVHLFQALDSGVPFEQALTQLGAFVHCVSLCIRPATQIAAGWSQAPHEGPTQAAGCYAVADASNKDHLCPACTLTTHALFQL